MVAVGVALAAQLLAPAVEVDDDGRPPAAGDDPDDVGVAVVDLLVLREGRDEREVTGTQLLPRASVVADDAAVAADGVDDCVCWLSVSCEEEEEEWEMGSMEGRRVRIDGPSLP